MFLLPAANALSFNHLKTQSRKHFYLSRSAEIFFDIVQKHFTTSMSAMSVMGVGGRRDFSSSSKCEYCHQTNNVELIKSDIMVCQSCYDVEEQEFSARKEDKTEENDLLNEDINYFGSTEIEGIKAEAAMTVSSNEEDNLEGESAESNPSNSTVEDSRESSQVISVRNTASIVIRKSSSQEQRCGKCEKKMVNGVRCSDCGKEVHWRCDGVTKDNEKAKIIESNCWKCIECRLPALVCNLCNSKAKEIKA